MVLLRFTKKMVAKAVNRKLYSNDINLNLVNMDASDVISITIRIRGKYWLHRCLTIIIYNL